MELPNSGKLEKVLILAFESAELLESGGIKAARGMYRASLNPEKYSLGYQVKQEESNPIPGNVGKQLRYFYTPPDDLSLEFLFDGTGVIEGAGDKFGSLGVHAELEYFKNILVGYHGEKHSPYYLMVIWGPLLFKGCAVDMKVEYKLFSPNGLPIRATANVTFRQSIESNKGKKEENSKSADLTHIIRVKAGDTLPLLCKKVYDNPKYYLQVAAVNNLGNFRHLEPGTELVFPPIDKIKS